MSTVFTNNEQFVHRLYPEEYFSEFAIFSPVYLTQIPLQNCAITILKQQRS